jgi:uncharacterized protein (TIGR02246 family)
LEAYVLTTLFVSLLAFAPEQASAQAPPAPASVEARLRQFEDKDEIARLLLDYGRHLDSRNLAGYASLFAKDGEWVGGFGTATGGPAGIQAFMEKSLGTGTGPSTSRNYHLMSNFVINVTGDTATAWSRWTYVVPGATGGAAISQAGRYDDTLVRENGRWKIKRRVASNDTGARPAAK